MFMFVFFRQETPLHYAAYHGRREAVLLFMARGADVNARCVGGTAADLALANNHAEIAQLLQQPLSPQTSLMLLQSNPNSSSDIDNNNAKPEGPCE
jgi:ankyrin repeat protein